MSANYALTEFKNYCENVWYEGGGTFFGYVQYIDSLAYPNGYPCGELILNEGWITWWTCNTCTASGVNDSLYRDTLECNRICKHSNLSCIYSYGAEFGQLYGTAYPSCGATDSTIVGCEELESSSSTEESSSSGEGEGGEDEESSSSGAGGGGEEGSSSSGETINPGEDEDDGGFICDYFSPGDPFDSTGLCLTSGNDGLQFYNPPTQIGGYNAIKDSIWIKCEYNRVDFYSYIGQIARNPGTDSKDYCYTNSNCISDITAVIQVGESWECRVGEGEIGYGCSTPSLNDLGNSFTFEVGSNGRLYYDASLQGNYFMPSNISLDELLNGKYDVYESFPRQGLLGAQVSLQEAYTICDSVWNYENDTPPDTSSIPETFSSSSAEGGENPPIDPPEGLTSSSAEGGGDNPPIGGNSSSGSGGSIGGITNGTGGRDESKAEEVYSSFMDKYSFSPLDTSGGTEGNYALREDVWKIYDILKDFASMMKDGVASLLGYGEAITENTDTLRHDLKLSLINDSTSIDLQISIDSLLRIIANSPIKFDSSYQETYDNGWSAVQQWMKSTIRTGSSGGSGGTVDSSWSLAVVDTSNNIIAQQNLDTLEAIKQLLQAYFTTAWIQQDSSIKLSHEMDSLLKEIYTTQTSLENSNSAIVAHTSNTASNTSSIAGSNNAIATNTSNIYGATMGILNGVLPTIKSSQDTASKYSKQTFDMLNGGTFMSAMGYVAYGLNGTLSGQYNGMQAMLTGQHNALMTGINGLGGGLDSGFGGLSTLLDTNLNVKGNPGDTSGSGGYWDGISGEGEADGDDLINSIFGFGESYADSVYQDVTNSDSSNAGKDSIVYSYDSSAIKSHLDSSVKQDSIQFVNKLTSVFDTLRKEFLLVDFDSLLMGDIGAKVPNTNTCPEYCFKGTINTDTEYLKSYNYDIGICSWKIFGLDALQFIRLILRLLTAFSCVYIGVWALSGRR